MIFLKQFSEKILEDGEKLVKLVELELHRRWHELQSEYKSRVDGQLSSIEQCITAVKDLHRNFTAAAGNYTALEKNPSNTCEVRLLKCPIFC